ncbi:MAG: hypothetical protein Q9M48_12015 [Rhodobacterales bacterium]|nr:hypothetical protein [Rhodobacterales bacterium]
MGDTPARFSLKDQLFNAQKVAYLARLFGAASVGFDAEAFERDVMQKLLGLELKQRIDWIAAVLADHLPPEFPVAAVVIFKALPPPCDPALSDDDFGDFIFAPLGEYVAKQAAPENLALSLDLIEAITQRFSMEYAIRGMINQWPKQVMARLGQWATHPHYHVRRLVSEGTRPKLPWGIKLEIDPLETLALLDSLHMDDTRFVTRSVANHLNDIAKIDESAVTSRLLDWQRHGHQQPKELDWMTRHALRTLIKKGHEGALEILGYRKDAPVSAQITMPVNQLAIGDMLTFDVVLTSPENTPVLVDYVIWFQKANGTQSPKVFKLKQTGIKAGQALALSKSYRLKRGSTTLPLYIGPHRLGIQVNGRVLDTVDFNLI